MYRYKQLLWLRAIIITSELISHHGKDSHSCCVGSLERVMQDAIKTYLFTIVSNEQSWSSLRELHSSLQVRWWSSIMILEIFLKQFTQLPGPRCQGQAAFWVGMHDMSWAPALHMNVDSEQLCQTHTAPLRIPVSLTSFLPIKQGYLQTSPQSLKQCARQLQALKPLSGQFSVSVHTCVHTHTHTHTHTHDLNSHEYTYSALLRRNCLVRGRTLITAATHCAPRAVQRSWLFLNSGLPTLVVEESPHFSGHMGQSYYLPPFSLPCTKEQKERQNNKQNKTLQPLDR